jgi:RNA polymerase sigma-70 factor (ECF subfamily)
VSSLDADADAGRPEAAVTPGADHPLRLALEKAVARLQPRQRTVFQLFSVEGFTHGEIGKILGIPEGTSKTLLFEAKKKLQRWLKSRSPMERSLAS